MRDLRTLRHHRRPALDVDKFKAELREVLPTVPDFVRGFHEAATGNAAHGATQRG